MLQSAGDPSDLTRSESTPGTPARMTRYPPGARIEVRDAEWIVRTCESRGAGQRIAAVGASEFVHDEDAAFFTEFDTVELMRPKDTILKQDETPRLAKSRLFLTEEVTAAWREADSIGDPVLRQRVVQALR